MNSSLREVAALLRQRMLTPVDICERAITRAENLRVLNAFITETHELARHQAGDSDLRFERGTSLGQLDGLPVAFKDNFSSQGIQTSCASKMLVGYKPPYDATIVRKILEQGAVLMGKTNMDEFAMGTGSVDSCFGPVRNPWKYDFTRKSRDKSRIVQSIDRKSLMADSNRNVHLSAQSLSVQKEGEEDDYNDWYVCGGSSGGSAIAVAAGICFASIGSDTGGSVRSPAGHVGVVGLKPTYGLVSRHGLIPLINSLDSPGIFTRFVQDTVVMLNVVAGPCEYDSTTVQRKFRPVTVPEDPSVKGLKVGVPKEFHGPVLDNDTMRCWKETLQAMEKSGAQISEVSIPHNRYSIATYSVLCCAEVASNMARYDGIEYGLRASTNWSTEDLYAATRHEGFNDVVRGRILAGNYFLLKENYEKFFLKAQKVRRLISNDYRTVFDSGVDVLLTPTNISDADTYEHFCKEDNRTRTAQNDIYTQSVNLAGVPAVTVPVTLSSNQLPIGLQLIGDHFSEEKLLTIAQWLENHCQFPRLNLDKQFN